MTKGLGSTNCQLEQSHGNVKYSIENIVNNSQYIVNYSQYMWCQVGATLIGGIALKVVQVSNLLL